MSNNLPRMPDPVENNSFIPTLDRQGAIWLYVDEITQAYLDFAGQAKGTLLEIAAGYGHIVIKALEAGAGRVFANEIDAAQLAIINHARLQHIQTNWFVAWGSFRRISTSQTPPSMASTMPGYFIFSMAIAFARA
jgi:hypothetical protein